MRVHPAQPASHEAALLHERQHLGVGRDGSRRELAEQREDLFTVAHGAARQFADDKGMHRDVAALERLRQPGEGDAAAQMVTRPAVAMTAR